MEAKGQKFDPNTDPDSVQTIQSSKLLKSKVEEDAVIELMKEAEKMQISKNLQAKAEENAKKELREQEKNGNMASKWVRIEEKFTNDVDLMEDSIMSLDQDVISSSKISRGKTTVDQG